MNLDVFVCTCSPRYLFLSLYRLTLVEGDAGLPDEVLREGPERAAHRGSTYAASRCHQVRLAADAGKQQHAHCSTVAAIGFTCT